MGRLSDDCVRVLLRSFIYTNHKNQSSFAKLVDCSDVYVSKVLNGYTKIPSEWLEMIGIEKVCFYRKIKR